MPLISIGFDNATKSLIRELIQALNGDGNNNDELKTLIENQGDQLSAQLDDIKSKIVKLGVDQALVDQIFQKVSQGKTKLDSALTENAN